MRLADSLTKHPAYEVLNSEGTDLRRFSVTIVEPSIGVTAPSDIWGTAGRWFDSGIIRRIRMMFEDGLYRCMTDPSEKRMLIRAEQFKCGWTKASPARSNIGMLPTADLWGGRV